MSSALAEVMRDIRSRRPAKTPQQRAFERKYIHKTPNGWYFVTYMDAASGKWIAPVTWDDSHWGSPTESLTADSLSGLIASRKKRIYAARYLAERAAYELFGEQEGVEYTGVWPLRTVQQ